MEARRNITVIKPTGLEEIEQISRILIQRNKYVDFYHNYPNVDKEATYKAVEQCNKLIREILGI